MHHADRVRDQGWRIWLLQAPAMAIAGVFIGVSGLMSVTFGYRLGEPSGNALVFAAFAIGVEGFADLAMPLFWRRVRLIGRALLIAFFALCLAYKLTAANRFAAENLGKRETAVAAEATQYGLARDRVEALRKTIGEHVDVRSAAIVRSEIAALLLDPRADGCTARINGEVTAKVCPKVALLRTELARAEARDTAQAELPAAIGALRGMVPAAPPADATDAGAVAALLGLAGYRAASWSSFVAHLIMAICEAGAIVVPMLIGLAFGQGRRPQPGRDASGDAAAPDTPRDTLRDTLRDASPAPCPSDRDTPPPQTVPDMLTARTRQDIADLTAFFGAHGEGVSGERVQATAFYGLYRDWKGKRGESPVSQAQFGTVLTRHLGLTKVKSDGRFWYLGVRLRHPSQGGMVSRRLRAVAA